MVPIDRINVDIMLAENSGRNWVSCGQNDLFMWRKQAKVPSFRHLDRGFSTAGQISQSEALMGP